jgi:hypothetical protein
MLAVLAGLILLVNAVSLGVHLRRAPRGGAFQTSPEVLAFLGPLGQGGVFGGFRLARAEQPQAGQLALVLVNDAGERYVVDVHGRAAGAPTGFAETDHLALYLRVAQPGTPTPEPVAQACQALAAALREREQHAKPPALAPLEPPAK